MSNRIFIVMLRQPGKNDLRTDPFWEFGSFGCTGCHGKNLLHPKNCQIKDGDQLAFIQGGHLGERLLLVTPPVKRINHPGGGPKGRVELRWDKSKQPFRYSHAPSLFESQSPNHPPLFPELVASLTGINRLTVNAKFSSRFRARTHALESKLACELEAGFASAMTYSTPSNIIARYTDALPRSDVQHSPSERNNDYQELLKELTNKGPRFKFCSTE